MAKNTAKPVITLNLGVIFSLISLIFLLIGIYATAKTVVNVIAMKKYPTQGVLSFGFMGNGAYYQREEDCLNTQPYFDKDGKLRPATPDEKLMESNNQKSCINSVEAARDNTKANDINTSMFFTFLGGGLLIAKKFISN